MKRTRIIIIFLALLVAILSVLKITYHPPDSSSQSSPSPAPTQAITPTLIPTLALNPTPSNQRSFQSVNHIFSFTYPDTWKVKPASSLGPLPEHWQLTAATASVSASPLVFDFTLSLASKSSVPSLTCAQSDTNCQILTINQVPYKLNATLNQNQVASVRYTATAGAYLINITGTMNQNQAQTYLNDWDKITQSFTFRP